MFKKHLFLLILFVWATESFSTEYLYSGARSLALANANVTLYDIWSTNNNQAGLAHIRDFGLGFSYENRFGLSELSVKNLNLALPVKWGTFGLTVQQLGYSDYSENKFGLAYGMKLSKRLSLGVQLDYLLVSVAETQTPNKDAFTAEIGLQAQLTEKLKLGVHFYNAPNANISGDFKEKVPSVLRIGLNYEFSKKVFSVLDIEKNMDLAALVKLGIEYHPIAVLYFRGGIDINTDVGNELKFSAGLGTKLKGFNLDLGFSHQAYIGYISQVSLSYQISKK